MAKKLVDTKKFIGLTDFRADLKIANINFYDLLKINHLAIPNDAQTVSLNTSHV